MSRLSLIIWLALFAANLTWIFLPDKDQDKGSFVALLKDSRGMIEIRKAGLFSWKKAHQGSRFHTLDSISVSASGQATIQLNDGTELDLPGGTLLKFKQRPLLSGVEITVREGGIVVRRSPPDTKAKNVKAISSRPLAIVKQGYTIDLTLLAGDFKLSKDSQMETTEADKVVINSKDGVFDLSKFVKPMTPIAIDEHTSKPDPSSATQKAELSLFDQTSLAAKTLVAAEWENAPSSPDGGSGLTLDQFVREGFEINVLPEEKRQERIVKNPVIKSPSLTAAQLADFAPDKRVEEQEPTPATVIAESTPPQFPSIPIKPGEQAARLYFLDKRPGGDIDPKLWPMFCAKLGQNLSLAEFNRGFISSHECLKNGTPLSQNEKFLWHIELILREDKLDVSVMFGNKSHNVPVESLHFKIDSSLTFLRSKKFPAILAGMLLERIPTGWAYLHQGSTAGIKMQSKREFPSTPFRLALFDLHYDTSKKKWVRKVYGKMTRVAQTYVEKNSRLETYAINKRALPLETNRYYWTQSTGDGKERQNYFNKLLEASSAGIKVLDSLLSNVLAPIKSSYIGLRYGRSGVDGSYVVKKAELFSLLIELRDGPLSGLRWYYDLVPRVQQGTDDSLEYFSLKRASLGWAFSFPAPSLLLPYITQFDIQPKIGLLDLSSRISVQTPKGFSSLSFDAKNIYDLSLEMGLEKHFSRGYGRAWSSISTAGLGVSNKSQVSVVNSRVGLDAYFDILNAGSNFNINVLAFVLAENLALTRPADADSSSKTIKIYDASFGLFFFGGGISVSW